MGKNVSEQEDLSYLKGYRAALNDFVVKLMAKGQRIEQTIQRLSGEDEPGKD